MFPKKPKCPRNRSRSLGGEFGPSVLRRRPGERELREFRQKPESLASQPAIQPGVNYRPYVSLLLSLYSPQRKSPSDAQKTSCTFATWASYSLRTRNNAHVAGRIIKNNAYAVQTISMLPFPLRMQPHFWGGGSILDFNGSCMQRRAALTAEARWLAWVSSERRSEVYDYVFLFLPSHAV